MDNTTETLLQLSRQLLDAIDAGDWETYTALCDPTLTAFEPEAVGHLVAGMPFTGSTSTWSATAGRGSRRSARRTSA